jgi:hypothetical protein
MEMVLQVVERQSSTGQKESLWSKRFANSNLELATTTTYTNKRVKALYTLSLVSACTNIWLNYHLFIEHVCHGVEMVVVLGG